MALVRSIFWGSTTSLLFANVPHLGMEPDGGPFAIASVSIGDLRVSWSWSVFLVVTLIVWLIAKAFEHIS